VVKPKEEPKIELLTSKSERKKYIIFAWKWFLFSTVCVPLIGLMMFWVLPKNLYYGNLIGGILGVAIMQGFIGFWIVGGYVLYCYGRSGTQTLNVFEDVFVFSYYSGSSDNCTTDTYYIKNVDSYTLKKRSITIKGNFKRVQSGSNSSQKVAHCVTIPRTFENEEILIDFFDKHIVQKKIYKIEN